jgi:aminoglycoside 6'-N-acetyltransferase I
MVEDMKVREMLSEDREAWLTMRSELWPGARAEHVSEIDAYLDHRASFIDQAFICEREDQHAGFVELRIRNYAEGSEAFAVPYVEGWFVDEQHRRRGVGSMLISRSEQWARVLGYKELASDAEIDNEISISAHLALGFREVERSVAFLKELEESTEVPRERESWAACPILGMRDVAAAAEYFRSNLGFELTSILDGIADEPAVYAIVKRGGIEIHLQIRRGNAPAAEREQIENDIYVRIQNPDALRDEFVRRGVKLLRDIMDEPYGMRDFSIFGPEGCRLVFGAPMTGDDRN